MPSLPPRDVTLRRLQLLIGDYLDGPRRGSLIPAPGTGRLGPVRLYSELYQRLIAPVQGALERTQTVYIVPAGPLRHIPMGALTPELGDAPWTANRRVV
ncbi:MAG: hypothetical protein IPK16_28150 [Anaerolineales bacterium]|nr:hypothetical protein [Anaerolineales bacterium]